MSTSTRFLGGALADAFLGGSWERAGLLERATELLGRQPRWVGPVVTSVLTAFPAAPRDRPRALADYVASLERLEQEVAGARRRQRPIRLGGDRPVGPTATVRLRWGTPTIDDLAALAEFLNLTADQLDWYADRRSMNRRAPSALRHYRYGWAGGRLIEAPKPRLRSIQRHLLADLVGRIPVADCVHGFVPGRSAHTFAAAHVGRRTVIRIDLVSFFTSITAARVYGLFRTAGYPEPVAHTLAALCTSRTPPEVIRSSPASLAQREHRLGLLRSAHLPQGAPTSPALANLCGYRLDRRLAGLAAAFGATYTRYADDLAFSGDLLGNGTALVRQVDLIVRDERFRVHPAKVRIRGRGDQQLLAGLVVNERPAVPRREFDALRATLHDAARHGLAVANRAEHPDFAAHLIGRVSWVGHGHPGRAARLGRLLAAALGPGQASDQSR